MYDVSPRGSVRGLVRKASPAVHAGMVHSHSYLTCFCLSSCDSSEIASLRANSAFLFACCSVFLYFLGVMGVMSF